MRGRATYSIPPDLREAFADAAKRQDSNASRELRNFMRDYVKKYGQSELPLGTAEPSGN